MQTVAIAAGVRAFSPNWDLLSGRRIRVLLRKELNAPARSPALNYTENITGVMLHSQQEFIYFSLAKIYRPGEQIFAHSFRLK